MKTTILLLFISTIFLRSNLLSQALPWQEANSITNASLKCVACPKSNSLYPDWICGDNGTVIKTSSYWANNWVNESGNGLPANINLVTIGCNVQNTAVTAGNIGANTFVYRTTNGGTNWSLVFTQNGGTITSLSFGLNNNTSNFVFMVGNPVAGRWSLWKSTDAGLSWDSTGLLLMQAGTEHSWNNSIWTDLTSNSIWFGTNNNRIYYSSNAGASWTIQNVTEPNIYSFWFNGANGNAAGSSLLKTTNSGVNWTQQIVPGIGNFVGIGGTPVSTNIEAFTRGTDTVYFSNGPSTWYSYKAPAGSYTFLSSIRSISFWDPQYALRDNGGVSFRFYWPEGISKISDGIPNRFLLNNNYPNPFNPATVIEYQIPVASYVKLTVFDLSGRNVKILVNENQSPGTYRTAFDGTNFSSGIYFYRLESDGYTNVKKMILIK